MIVRMFFIFVEYPLPLSNLCFYYTTLFYDIIMAQLLDLYQSV